MAQVFEKEKKRKENPATFLKNLIDLRGLRKHLQPTLQDDTLLAYNKIQYNTIQ